VFVGGSVEDWSAVDLVVGETSTPGRRDHVHARNRIPFAAADIHDEYAQNIQVADLNALNATLAVIAWKSTSGSTRDLEREYFTTYTVDATICLTKSGAREDSHPRPEFC
jgi:hypothetical protein